MSTGKITQIIGAVIDVEFPSDAIPKVYNALNVTKTNLTLEVQQQLGDMAALSSLALANCRCRSRTMTAQTCGRYGSLTTLKVSGGATGEMLWPRATSAPFQTGP